ncbi:hypothetical protein T265_13615, partial [Opisthorchis viverrini]
MTICPDVNGASVFVATDTLGACEDCRCDDSFGTIFEISQYIFMKETTHKVAENSSTAHDRFLHFWDSSGRHSPRRLKHEAAWCSTFSCLRTSQTRDSAGFQGSPEMSALPSYVTFCHEHKTGRNLKIAIDRKATGTLSTILGSRSEPPKLAFTSKQPLKVHKAVITLEFLTRSGCAIDNRHFANNGSSRLDAGPASVTISWPISCGLGLSAVAAYTGICVDAVPEFPSTLCSSGNQIARNYRNTLIGKLIWFFERLTLNLVESLICDVSRQLNVLRQDISCFIYYDIRDIAIYAELSSSHSGVATAEKFTPRKIGREFGTLAGPVSRRNLIGRKSGPNSQSLPSISRMPATECAAPGRLMFQPLRYLKYRDTCIYLYCNVLLIRLLKIRRQPTTPRPPFWGSS